MVGLWAKFRVKSIFNFFKIYLEPDLTFQRFILFLQTISLIKQKFSEFIRAGVGLWIVMKLVLK